MGFRLALTLRHIPYVLGVRPQQHVYPADVTLIAPETRTTRSPRGYAYAAPSVPSARVTTQFTDADWHRLTWRDGTKGPLTARFAGRRVRPTDGPYGGKGRYLPGDEVWLIGERRDTGEVRYYFSTLPADWSLLALVRVLKQRWACEQSHEQLKNELGLDHFEGRSWRGLRRHTVLTLMAYAFLQTQRMQHSTAQSEPPTDTEGEGEGDAHRATPGEASPRSSRTTGAEKKTPWPVIAESPSSPAILRACPLAGSVYLVPA
jgi:SRSO17 transposase